MPGPSFHTPRLSSRSLRYARSRRRPKPQACSSNWHRAMAARAAAIASSLLLGLSTMTGLRSRALTGVGDGRLEPAGGEDQVQS